MLLGKERWRKDEIENKKWWKKKKSEVDKWQSQYLHSLFRHCLGHQFIDLSSVIRHGEHKEGPVVCFWKDSVNWHHSSLWGVCVCVYKRPHLWPLSVPVQYWVWWQGWRCVACRPSQHGSYYGISERVSRLASAIAPGCPQEAMCITLLKKKKHTHMPKLCHQIVPTVYLKYTCIINWHH